MPKSDQGLARDRYKVIPRVLIFLTRGNTFLLLKGASTKRSWAGRYNGVGGHIEKGEDVLAAARRELREETGLVSDLWLCGTLIVDVEHDLGIGLYIFTGECLSGEPILSEEGTLEWISFDSLSSLPIVDDVLILLPKIRGMVQSDPPFSGRSYYDDNGKIVVEFST